MNRSTRHIMIVIIAVATATLASFGVYRAVTRMPVREIEVARSFVVVASRSLPPGVRLAASDVRVAAWPASSPVTGSFSKVDAVVNHALLASVVENEPLVKGKLASIEEGVGLPPSIPPGMRAMSVKVNEVIGVAGWVDPGTRVDLVVTIDRAGLPSTMIPVTWRVAPTPGTEIGGARLAPFVWAALFLLALAGGIAAWWYRRRTRRPLPAAVVRRRLRPEP